MFTKQTEQKLSIFLSKFVCQSFKKKSIILHADNDNRNIFYVKNGYLKAYRISDYGEELTLAILKRGDFFPISSIVDDFPNPYYLEALTTVEVFIVPQQSFLKYLRDNPEIFYELTTYIMLRFGSILNRIEHLVTTRAYEKVASTLFVCAKRFGEKKNGEIIFSLPLTHRDVATLVGITRETACLEMKKLERKGLISHKGRLIVVKDMKGLGEESLLDEEKEIVISNSL